MFFSGIFCLNEFYNFLLCLQSQSICLKQAGNDNCVTLLKNIHYAYNGTNNFYFFIYL